MTEKINARYSPILSGNLVQDENSSDGLSEVRREEIQHDIYKKLITAVPLVNLSLPGATMTRKKFDRMEEKNSLQLLKFCKQNFCTKDCAKKVKETDEITRPERAKTDFTIQWKSEHCPYIYNDHNYAILPDIPRRFKALKSEWLMNSLFFSCFCEKRYDGTRRLILNGNDLEPRIRRRFHDWDVPYLMVFLRSNRDVVSLSLAYNRIHCAGFMNLIDYINAYNHVVELNVQNNLIKKPGIDHLCHVGESLRLRTLRLNGNKFGVEAAKKIATLLPKNPFLRHLDVAEVDQTTSSLVYFTTVMRNDQHQYNDTLKILDLSRPITQYKYSFDSTHFASVIGAMLKVNKSLVELHLQKCSFTCHDVELMLVNARHNDTLHLLDLNSNNIGDHGIEHLANWLAERPTLTGLLLGHNIITSNGARSLSFSLPFSRIRMLDLSHNKITDCGMIDLLNTLKKSTRMRHMRMFGNDIGHDTAKIVKRMLVAGVLEQEHLDIKPYRVDHKWYLAHYPADKYKQRYYDVPYFAFPQMLKLPFVANKFKGMAKPKVCFKYVNAVPIERRRPKLHRDHPLECVCCECAENEAMNSLAPSVTGDAPGECICCVCQYERNLKEPGTFRPEVTFVPKPPCACHSEDCICCYCDSCKGKEAVLPAESDDHPTDCTCCQCGVRDVESGSSSISIKSDEPQSYPSGTDIVKKVSLILERVNTEMQKQILRWVNIDEATLEEDLLAAEHL